MPIGKDNLSFEQKKIIKELLIKIFKDIYFNNINIIKAKTESDKISEKIKNFIIKYIETEEDLDELELLLRAKDKGIELIESHDLIFFDDKVDKELKMRAFLIPGLKIEISDEVPDNEVTEDDMQAVDYELCVSFRTKIRNEFVKIGNLIDIRASLAKSLDSKSKNEKEAIDIITESNIFQKCLEDSYEYASKVV